MMKTSYSKEKTLEGVQDVQVDDGNMMELVELVWCRTRRTRLKEGSNET